MELKRDSFKAYDIRGKYPEEVNEDLAYVIGRVFADMLQAKKVAVGHDIRLSGPSWSFSPSRSYLSKGLMGDVRVLK